MKNKPQKIPYEDYQYIFSKVPRLCVDMIIRGKEGILLIERAIDPGKGMWHFPGGGVLKGESLEEAMNRIALDELSVSVHNKRLLGMMEFSDPDSPYFHTVSVVYEVIPSSDGFEGGEQGKNIRFFKEMPEKMIREQKSFVLDNIQI